ncbi:MAG TPA: D-aminoacylase [Rubrobacter sp.]|nr:D-aminoacylase [Rubrobacter sp.]
MLDLVLENGRLVDGTGNPWFFGDVGIKDGKIVEVGRVNQRGLETIDAGGWVVSPGFIDGHCHSDLMVLDDPGSEIKLQQWVTTEVVGNCGMTPAPFAPQNLDLLRTYGEPVLGSTGQEWRWETVEQYFDALTEAEPSENVATYVGHGTLRIAVMDFENRPASGEELDRMKGLLDEALQAGAIGLSLGLMYAPGSYTPREELAELCSVLSRYGGLLATHIRGEGNSLIPSVEEVIWIAEKSGVPLQISHLKAAGGGNWGSVTRAMELIERARSRGLDVTCDVYPYTAGSTSLTTLLPPWTLEGGVSRTLGRLGDPTSRKRIKAELGQEQDNWDNLVAFTGWDSVYVSSLSKDHDAKLAGKNVVEVSESRGIDPEDCMMDLLLEQDGKVSIVFFHMAGSDVEQVIGWERSLIASDSLHDQAEKPHPRLYGTFPHVLARYVREKKLLSLEEAVRKLTSFPARRFNLGKRGLIAPGYAADLVVFDPETIQDTSTYEDPKHYPEGISHVLVNGTRALESGALLETGEGKVIGRENR